MSIKVQVIFYSMYGHVYRMAQAVVEGAQQVPGAEVSLYQVAELMPDEVLDKYGAKQLAPPSPRFPLRPWTNCPMRTPLFLGPPRDSATWSHRCATSSIKPAACGPMAL